MISAAVRRDFDRLVVTGAITGYTVEPPPLYLISAMPTLTYSVYGGDPVSRGNLRHLLDDLSALTKHLTIRPIEGNAGRGSGIIERSRQLRVAASFSDHAQLDRGLDLIRDRYQAGSGDGWVSGSWQYPDVRVTGSSRRPPGTIRASAHQLPLPSGSQSVVVLSLSTAPPRAGMQAYPVFLLERWHRYLEGEQSAGAWFTAWGSVQTVTPALAATGR